MHVLFATAVLLAGLYYYAQTRFRSAMDVYSELKEEQTEVAPTFELTDSDEEKEDDELTTGSLQFLSYAEKKKARLLQAIGPIVGGCFLGVLSSAFLSLEPFQLLSFVLGGAALSWVGLRGMLERKEQGFVRDIEFFLPVVMERLVMAVEAGLDCMSGIKELVRIEQDAVKRDSTRDRLDPVTQLLGAVATKCDGGLALDRSLKQVSYSVECPALRHAFLHIGHAYREGGELIMPLRELADSTQLYFQESTEEKIAKMPIKATGPLLFTFIGILLLIMSTPLVQVISMAQEAVPK